MNRKYVIKLATPVSYIFKDEEAAKGIARYSDCFEGRDSNINFEVAKQEVFHCELQPIHELASKDFAYLKRIREEKPNLRLITFHCATNCDKPTLNENEVFEVGGLIYSEKEMQENARNNFLKIKEIFGDNIKIGIENNNYYPAESYKYVTEPKFIASIVYDSGINFLFDIAHAKVTCHNKKIELSDYKKELPLGRLIQLHVSHYRIEKDNFAYDAHEIPGQEEIEEVKNLINNFDIKYLTTEFYKDKNSLINSLKEFRKII